MPISRHLSRFPPFLSLFYTSLLSLSLFALSLCIPFILSLRVLFFRPSSHLSSRVLLRYSPAPSAPRFVTPSFSCFSFSLLLSVPSVVGPDGPIVPCSPRLTGLLMAYRIEREVDPCCYAATAAEIHEKSEREKKRERERGSRAETNGRRATAMIIIRGPNNQCGLPTRPRVPSLLLLFFFYCFYLHCYYLYPS